uniref:Uncharacterized protein n=1 Tax=Meloidogyne enterolobii TaxID=390850 RepID=A0A6V7TQF7_MELEN|nr:unnamed protein product [Meloidogyne enterolobii]
MRLIINYILIIFLIKTSSFTVALKCFQGITPFSSFVSMNSTMAGMYLPPDCPMPAASCMKAVDYSRQVLIYSCMTTNCTNMPLTSSSPGISCFNSANNPFCCCSGDGCNSRFMAPYCEALGIWSNWGDWSSCPSTTNSSTMLNIRRRLRTCSSFSGCDQMSQFQCIGNYSEVLPCTTTPSPMNNSTNSNTSNIPPPMQTTPPTINTGVGGPIVVDLVQSAKIIATGALSAGLVQSMQS